MKRILFPLLTLLLYVNGIGAQQVDTVAVQSHMGCEVHNLVILPENYKNDSIRYPVVYLLHGYGGNHLKWLEIKPNLPQLATQYQLIIVCPNGKNSWYWNSLLNADIQYEDYISDEIVSYIDNHYRTRADRKGRAITGLSMGGHGAMWNAIRHRDIFGAAGSTSGGLDIRPFPGNWNMSEQIGTFAENPERWNNYTVINLIPTLNDGELSIIIDCGVDDFFYKVNMATHQALLDRGIRHDFIIRPGAHNDTYWNNSIDYQLLFFHNYFQE